MDENRKLCGKKRKMPKNISILRKFGTKQNKKFQNFIDHQNFF